MLALACAASPLALFAAKPSKEEIRAMKRDGLADDTGGKSKKRDDSAKPSPADNQARTLERLREKLDVPDDTEWALIVERVSKIEEIRRTL